MQKKKKKKEERVANERNGKRKKEKKTMFDNMYICFLLHLPLGSRIDTESDVYYVIFLLRLNVWLGLNLL